MAKPHLLVSAALPVHVAGLEHLHRLFHVGPEYGVVRVQPDGIASLQCQGAVQLHFECPDDARILIAAFDETPRVVHGKPFQWSVRRISRLPCDRRIGLVEWAIRGMREAGRAMRHSGAGCRESAGLHSPSLFVHDWRKPANFVLCSPLRSQPAEKTDGKEK